MARGTRCIVHAHDYPTAQEHHHLQPKARGGTNAPDNMVWLCANGHGDVHYFLDLIEKHGGERNIPWSTAKHYGPSTRRIARAGWMKYERDFHAGVYDRHRLLWSTSGQPVDGMPHGLASYGVAELRGEANYWLSLAALGTSVAARVREIGNTP